MAANGDYSLIDAKYGYSTTVSGTITVEERTVDPAVIVLQEGVEYTFTFIDADHPDGVELTAVAAFYDRAVCWEASVGTPEDGYVYSIVYVVKSNTNIVDTFRYIDNVDYPMYPVTLNYITSTVVKIPSEYVDSIVPIPGELDLGKVLMAGRGGYALWESLPASGLKIQTTNVTINKSNTSITAGQLTTVSKTISTTYDKANGTIKATFLISNNADYKVMYLSDLQNYGSGDTIEDLDRSMTVLGLNTTTVNSVSCTVVVLYQ